jgi:hypothetical protein
MFLSIEFADVKYGFENRLTVGPWVIWADYDPPIQSTERMLSRKAVDSWETLMTGKIEYYISVPSVENSTDNENTNPLESFLVVMDSFSKETRPQAWKHTDLRIQNTLPLLGNDLKAIDISTEKYALAKVTLKLENV